MIANPAQSSPDRPHGLRSRLTAAASAAGIALLDRVAFQKAAPRLRTTAAAVLRVTGGLGVLKERNRYHIRRHLRKSHTRLVSYPKLIHVEMTTFCNIRCRMCSIVRPARTRKIQHIEMSVIKRLERALPFISDSKLHGGGEPFLNPNIERIVEIFQRNQVRLNTVTNATVIRENLARLIGRSFSTLTVSIDGSNAETYELVRERSSFARVLDAVELLNKWRHPDFKLIFGFVIMRCNAHELPEMVRLCRERGANELQAAWVVPFPDLPWSQEQDPTREPERMNRHLQETYAAGLELGISVKLPPPLPVKGAAGKALASHRPVYHDLHPTHRVEGLCRLMYDRCMILVDGTVKPCGQSRSVPDLGSLRDQEFDEIWSGAGYQRLRSTFANGTLPVTCQSCNFIRSGQLGSARLIVEDPYGDVTPLMQLDRPR